MSSTSSLSVPNINRKSLHVTAAYLAEHGECGLSAVHFRRDGGAFVTAEGVEGETEINAGIAMLFAVGGGLYGFARIVDLKYLFDLTNDKLYFMTDEATDMASFCTREGEEIVYIATDSHCFKIQSGTYAQVSSVSGGDCIAVHRERLYVGKGSSLCYSAPLETATFALTEARTGKIALSTAGGNIVDLVSFGDRLIVFREREILRLRADADDLDFKFEKVPFDAGMVMAKSARNCGNCVVFLAERGLCTLRENGCERAYRLPEGVVPVSPAVTAAHAGRFYAIVTLGSGEKAILCYDPAEGVGHIILHHTDLLAGDHAAVYCKPGETLMRLTPQGAPAGGEEPFLSFRLALSARGPVRQEAVCVEGEGQFTLALKSGKTSVEIAAPANAVIPLPRVLRGTHVRVELRTNANASVQGFKLYYREDAA